MKTLLTILSVLSLLQPMKAQWSLLNGRRNPKDTITGTSFVMHGGLVPDYWWKWADTVQNLTWKQEYPTYEWRQVSGAPAVFDSTGGVKSLSNFSDGTTRYYLLKYDSSITVYNLQHGTYQFELTFCLWDIYGVAPTDFDTMTLIVLPDHPLALEDSSHIIVYHPEHPEFSMNNPAKGDLQVNFPSDRNQLIRVELYDIAGRNLVNKQLAATRGQNTWHINVSEYATGYYILRLTDQRQFTINVKVFIVNKKP